MDKIQITMLGPREVGKTSLLTALYGQLDLTIRGSGLNLWPDEETRLIIQKYKQNFQDLTNTLEGGPPPTSDARKSNLRSFTFEIGSGDKRSLKLIFKDPPGAYLSTLATDEQRKDAEDLLKECSVVVIPIDAAALMQKNSSQEVDRGQVGTWHEEKNNAWYVTELLKMLMQILNHHDS